MVLALVDDLLFGSKVRAAAQAASRQVVFVRGRAPVLEEVRRTSPTLIVIDLDREAPDTMDVIRAIKSSPDLSGVNVVGFVAHTHTDRITAAREAGIDTVLARSAFFPSLPALLSSSPSTSPA